MTENSSVYALVGTLLPNQKDPPSGGKFPKLVKARRNFTQLVRHVVTRSWSKFHLQASCGVIFGFPLFPVGGTSAP